MLPEDDNIIAGLIKGLEPTNPMPYHIIVSAVAEEDLRKFDPELQRRFFKKIEKLKEEPKIYGKPLRYNLAGKWELRFEKRWRIIYTVDEHVKQVEIIAVWHKDDF